MFVVFLSCLTDIYGLVNMLTSICGMFQILSNIEMRVIDTNYLLAQLTEH